MSIDLKTIDIKPLRNTYAIVAELIGGDKPASRYQEAVLGVQQTDIFHYRPTWDPDHEIYDPRRTAIKMKNWYAFKDPRQYYYGNWTMARARQQETMEANYTFVEKHGLVRLIPEEVKCDALALLPLRHVAWGANMNNSAICAYGYGTAITAPSMFYAMDQLAIAQYLTRLGLALEGPEALDRAKEAWLHDPQWQGLRRYVEDTFVVSDWFELFVAQNLVLDGLWFPLVYGTIINDNFAARNGSAVAMMTAFMTEWSEESSRWVDAQVKTAAAESDENRVLLSGWMQAWRDRASSALMPIAGRILGDQAQAAMDDVLQQFAARCAKLGLSV